MAFTEGKTFIYNKASIESYAAVVGKTESDGPYGGCFDEVIADNKGGAQTWEQAESLFQQKAVGLAMEKACVKPTDIDLLFAGDLLNQCVGSSGGLKDYFIPFLGIFGACSTFAEGLLLAGAMVNAGYVKRAMAVTSSHYSSAERQFRFPLNYGAVRTPTAQWTATASGAALVCDTPKAPYIRAATAGKIQDMGITDANNMGAAMAPAAVDTIVTHFTDTGFTPSDYDMILTGDLASVGSDIARDLLYSSGFDVSNVYNDCGNMVFDIKGQDVHAGGSGCGCSGIVFCGYIMDKLRKGELNRILLVGTGALMSPLNLLQGENIPGIAHAITVQRSL